METKRKRNDLAEDADKIEEMAEELKNGEDKFQEKPSAKKPKKNGLLARLRRAWTRVIGYMGCCTSIQVEESHVKLSQPRGTNMADRRADSSKGKEKEDDKRERNIVNITDEREDHTSEETSSNSFSLEEIPEELSKSDKTSQSGSGDDTSDSCSLEEDAPQELSKSSKTSQSSSGDDYTSDSCSLVEEILENLYKSSETSQSGRKDDMSNSCSLKKEAPQELSKSSKISQSGSGDDTSDSCSLEEDAPQELSKSSQASQSGRRNDTSDSCSLKEELPQELSKSSKISQSGSGDDTSDSCSLEEDAPQELSKSGKTSQSGRRDNISNAHSLVEEILVNLYKFSKTSQSGGRDDASDSCSLKEELPQELSKSDSCTLAEGILEEPLQSTKTSQSGRMDDKSYSCTLVEEILEVLFKSSKASQSSRRDGKYDSCPLEEEAPQEFFKSTKTFQSSRRDDTYDSCSLELPQELSKSSKSSESCINHDEESTISDVCLEEPNQSAKETSGTVPLSLNSFTFHQELGSGSYGKVYLAKDVIRKECVAIKVSHKQHVLSDYNFAERHVLQLSHESPYLIHGLAAYHTQSFVYYVMELATGGDLHYFIRKTFPLDTATIQFIIAEIICGIQFLHKNGILHRDLKPGNILLTAEGHVKLSDFGFCKLGVYEKTNELRRGTPGYAAPEQLEGVDYGPGVDYFAIGVILYRLYHFKNPFNGKDARDIDLAVLSHTPHYRNALSQDTVDILKGLLQKDPLKRLGVNGDIKNHQYFKDLNWEDLEARRVAPPAIMTATSANPDVSYTLPYAEQGNNIRPIYQRMFNEFSFVCAEWSRHYNP